MYDWEKDVEVRKDYFLYKGNAYSYDKENLSIQKNYEIINQTTEKTVLFYGSIANMEDFVSEKDLYKIKIKYQVKKAFYDIAIFDTRKEAEYFINLVTKKE